MSVSVYKMLRSTAGRVAALTLVVCVSAGSTAVAQMTDGDLVRFFDGEDLRDPTRPSGAVAPGQSAGESGASHGTGVVMDQYQVSFIRAGGSEPMAVINDQPVRVGEEINGARVLAIEAGVVALDVNGERRTFSTWQGEAVRQSTSSETAHTDTMNRERETDD